MNTPGSDKTPRCGWRMKLLHWKHTEGTAGTGCAQRLRRGTAALLASVLSASGFPAQVQSAATAPASAPATTEPRNGYAENLRPTKTRGGVKAVNLNQPYAPIRKVDDEGQIPEIEMFVGESRVFPVPGVARIAVGNGALLTAAALDNKEVILFANGAGTSSLFLWNADGRYQRVKISIVPGDTTRHAREIAAFLSTIPNAKASVVGANIIVEGDDLSDSDIAKIEELAKRYPQIVNFTNRVGWEQMVMMDVKVVEFPVTVLRDMGLKWNATGGAAIGGIWAPARRGNDGPFEIRIRTGQENAPPLTGPGGSTPVIPSGLNAISYLNMGLNAQLSLLAQEGKAAMLAEPQLSTRSGSKASFVAGGEIPYAVQTTEGPRVLFKTYGVKLDITPRVDHKKVIRATIQAEVSSIDKSVQALGGPALLSRKTETEFNLRDGETIVLSGLLQRDTSTDVDKVPFLGDLPVIGALFRSKRYQNKETELVVFVTPTVIGADSPGNADRVRRTTKRLGERMGDKPFLTEPLQPGVSYERPDVLSSAEPSDARHGGGAAPRSVEPAPLAAMPAPAPRVPVGRDAASDTPAAAPSARTRSSSGALLSVVANGTVLRAEPGMNAAALLQLDKGSIVQLGTADLMDMPSGNWRNVIVGSLQGWLPADAVEPSRGEAMARAAANAGSAPAQPGRQLRRPIDATADLPGRKTLTLSAAAIDARRYRVAMDGLALRITPDINAEIVARLISGDTVAALSQPPRGGWTADQLDAGDTSHRGWVASQWLIPVTP
jgi:pilus assembly protein CpaC